ncbi:hemin-degrading factor [Hymenobacter sp. BT559]|uniref:hemin-degrading factor n=1 Tax=Hymenobacter sp. BT559 TaxID=2795729 RepID=UPI0018EB04F9|nr:ChuX/HutX family heme-like substrate-binding protein [Hymenobacter sp. BT559]MBJ6142333.1 hemin-degrading factor [Hymenobacter sp. BT559]
MPVLTAPETLADRWTAYQQANPKSRIRDAARALGTSEAALLATRNNGQPDSPVIALAGDFKELLKQVPTLGRVMALTRNDSVVHERKGPYLSVSFQGPMGLVLGEDIDLRLFMMHWQHGFAVSENGRHSLQFFAADGEALHKIYVLDGETDLAAYEALVDRFRAHDQPARLITGPTPSPTAEAADAGIDVAGFQAAWRGLQDTHAFFGLLREFGLSRTQALRLGPPELVRQVDNQTIDRALRAAAAEAQQVMIFVSSRGCIQIHTGPVERIVPTGPWLNVLDPDFNLHLKLEDVAQSWVVQKPTADGIVTSLELFDAQGNNILLLFGKRKPGIPEQESWRALVAAL